MNSEPAVALDNNTFANIPVFSHMDEPSLDRLNSLFEKVIKNKNAQIISYHQAVDGIYVLSSGEVEIILPEYEKPIAVLGSGNCFGEMSLIEPGETASATVKVSSDTAEFLFCKLGRIQKVIEEDGNFARGFFESAAALMSHRLRQSNHKINNEIARGVISASKLIEDIELDSKIQQTSTRLDDAGYNIVARLSKSLASLRDMIENPESVSADEIKRVYEVLLEVYYGESQKFDRLSQEMQLIQQYFENLKRMIDGNRELVIRGDSSLFHKD